MFPGAEGADAKEQFMMDYEVKEEKPHPRTAIICALVMGFSYFLGGLIPLIPYFCTTNLKHGLYVSIAVTMLTLLVFGYARAVAESVKGSAAVRNALWTFIVGMAAAGTSYGIVYGVNKQLEGVA
jgi:predicted membrane protein (TIGR00267 family)